jgi:tetratricopeptide (TPR) repeat protein
MYLKGSKWSMNKRRRRRVKPWRIFVLVILIAGVVYVNQVIVPTTPPLFIPTPTATRSPETYISEGEAFLAEGKIGPAIQAFEKAIASDPQNPSNFVTTSRLQIYSGLYTDAARNAENALLLNANNSMAHALRGWALGFNGDYLQAISALDRAIELDAANAAAYAYKAEVLILQAQEGQGDLATLDKAVEASRTAEAMAPNSLEAHRARGTVLEYTGNYEEATLEFEATIGINPNISDLHLALGRNYRYLQQYDKAVEEFNRANALNPSDPMPDTNISRTYATVGEYAKAIQYALQAVKDTPSDPYMHGNLGQMYYRNREYPAATAALRLAVQGGTTEDGDEVEGLPLDYGRVAEYYYTYGLSLARQGECGEALQISQLLVQGVPNDETAVFNAEAIIEICQEVADSPLAPQEPEVTATPEGETDPE